MFMKKSLLVVMLTLAFILASQFLTTSAEDTHFVNKCDQMDGLRDDRVNCSSSGEVTCHQGWMGHLCNTAICRKGCHSVHGYCTQPGECKCALGWRGKDCNECVPLPGCKNGFCNTTSYECICEPGWEGNYCSLPVCRGGCHSSRGYCKRPNECRCRIGWDGDICDECKSLPGCLNGYCTKPLECRCREGWTGFLCDTPICRENCSSENGFCLKPDQCRCEVGWWGKNCDTCFPYPGCKHGTCTIPWECNCNEGWKGLLCDQKNKTGDSFCDRNPDVCLNGGLCINAPDNRNYTCSCSSLFTGKHCEYFAHSRASIFPIFSRGSASARSTLSTTPPTMSVAGTTSEPSSTPTSFPDSAGMDLKESSTPPLSHISVPYFISVSSARPSSIESLVENVEKVPSEVDATSTEERSTKPRTDEGFVDRRDSEEKTELSSPEFGSSDSVALDDRRMKYIERKYQRKTSSSKQPNISEKERVYPSIRFDDGVEGQYFTRKTVINSRSRPSNKPKLLKPQPPILVLELSEPTIDFDGHSNEDTITNTDANSPQANQIKGKNRFLRHHETVLGLSSNERIGQQSSFFPLRKVRLVTQEKPPRPSRLRTSSTFVIRKKVFDSLPQESAHDKNYFHPFTRDFSHLPPQTRINRRTGVPPSPLPVNSIPSISALGKFSPHEDHELTEASSANERKDKGVSQETPKTYYEEHYNGRVHIGDVTEVDKHAPLEAIVNAFIELKKLKT